MKPQMQKLTSIDKRLPVEITDKELRKRSQELGDVARKLEAAESAFALLRENHNKAVKPLREERTALIGTMETGIEHRDVAVDVYADFEAGTVIEVRTDTKEWIANRAMTEADRQMSLDGGNAERAEAVQ